MNIYLIWQNENRGYDTYDSAVVVAEDEESAKLIHPSTYGENPWKDSEHSLCFTGHTT